MKEYEKLLKHEDDRKNNIKARQMVRLGLFELETVESFNFDNAENITYNERKYKGNYELYETHEGQLIYVNSKTEDDNNTSAYAYDLIKIEQVTDEEYAELLAAGAKEHSLLIQISRISLLVMIVLTTISMLYQFISALTGGSSFLDSIFGLSGLFAFSFLGIEIGLYIVAEITYRKYFLK